MMKMHKIRGVDKEICTAEQKIAYNYAFRYRNIMERIRDSDTTAMAKEESYQQVVDWVIRGVKDNGIDKKYNIDAIVHCFRNGIKNYLNRFSIITSYEEIGKTFECLYGIE